MTSLTVFHDPSCGVCRRFRQWLEAQALWLGVEFVGFDMPEARRRFPAIGEIDADREIVVLADDGNWWQGPEAWLLCLWATREHRVFSHQLAVPRFRPWLRRIVHAVSSNRVRISAILGLRSERELAGQLPELECHEGSCQLPTSRHAKGIS